MTPRTKKQRRAPVPEFWTRYWHGLYATPRAWAHKGENLVQAFQLLAPAAATRRIDYDVADQALMIAGMAVEVSLKAIIVNVPAVRAVITGKRHPVNGKEAELRKVFYSHRLADLAGAAKVRLTASQRSTAIALSQYIYWRGRYVVPTEYGITDLVPIKQDDDLIGPSHRNVSIDAARHLLERVIRAVKKHLYGERRPSWRFPEPGRRYE